MSSNELGIIGLELAGTAHQLDEAMQFFRDRGVRVEPIELDVVAG